MPAHRLMRETRKVSSVPWRRRWTHIWCQSFCSVLICKGHWGGLACIHHLSDLTGFRWLCQSLDSYRGKTSLDLRNSISSLKFIRGYDCLSLTQCRHCPYLGSALEGASYHRPMSTLVNISRHWQVYAPDPPWQRYRRLVRVPILLFEWPLMYQKRRVVYLIVRIKESDSGLLARLFFR